MIYRMLDLVGSCEHGNVETLGPQNSRAFLEQLRDCHILKKHLCLMDLVRLFIYSLFQGTTKVSFGKPVLLL